MPKPCEHDSRELYDRLIGPIREKARELGYAIGVHGTLKRDIDLIACPWVDTAVPARQLAEAIRDVARSLNGGVAHAKGVEDSGWFQAGCPAGKPHGRLCWTYHLGGGPYIDLSVLPRWPDAEWTCGNPDCGCLNSLAAGETCWSCGRPRGAGGSP